MNLFIYTGAATLNAAIVTSATDLTPLARLPDVVFGDSEPVTIKFLSAAGTYESWSGAAGRTLSVSIGEVGADGARAYFNSSSFTTVTDGWSGTLGLATPELAAAVTNYLSRRVGFTSAPFTLQVRVTIDATGYTETYAKQTINVGGSVALASTPSSTPVSYATAADVADDAAAAAASAAAAAASASSASTSAGTATTKAGEASTSATAAAASATAAANSATNAANSATTATNQATTASTGASTATTKAGEASTSAAAAAVSAAAALASKNAAATSETNAGTSASTASTGATTATTKAAEAAASAASAAAVSGSGNGTFSNAAVTGVNSVTAPATTNLTLSGGSSGASLVLGQGASGGASIIRNVSFGDAGLLGVSWGTGATAIGGNGNDKVVLGYLLSTTNGATIGAHNSALGAWTNLNYNALQHTWRLSEAAAMRLSATNGNLLIGGTTDITGAGGLKVFGTTAATLGTITTGAFQTGGGASINGNLNVGLDLRSGTGTDYAQISTAGGVPTLLLRHTNTDRVLISANGDSTLNGGDVRIGNTNTALKLFVAGTTPATNTTSGALQVAGGMSAQGAIWTGGAGVFGTANAAGSGVGSYGATPSSGVFGFTSGSMTGTNMYGFTDQTATYTVNGAATEVIDYRAYATLALGANALTNWYGFQSTLNSKTGAGVLTNAYAYYASSPTAATNNYAFFSAGSAPSVLGGGLTSTNATAGLGYGTGAGGAVTQITSRTTGVTLNKVSGAITLFTAAGSATWQSFTVTNSAVAATDVVLLSQKSGTDLYMLEVTAVGAGSFRISFATTGGTTSEAPVFNFAVIKAVAA